MTTSQQIPVRPAGQPATGAPARNTKSIRVLFLVHVACGLLSCGLAAARFPIFSTRLYLSLFLLYAIVNCQAGLLGFWAAYSEAAWSWRLAGLVAGAGYLCLLNYLGEIAWAASIVLGAVTSVATVGILFLVRRRTARRVYVAGPSPKSGQPRLIFTIRGLMLFTLAVALFVAALKPIGGALELVSEWVVVYVLSLCFVIVTLASCWAALGLGHPVVRSVTVLVLAACLGILFTKARFEDVPWEFCFYLIVVLSLDAALSLASFFVVRRCGYQLVRPPLNRARTTR